MDFYLITYDIPDDKPRTRLADLLQDYGQRVQYSVFEAWLTPKHYQALISQLRSVLQDTAGQVRLYRLCRDCQKTVVIVGTGDQPQPPQSLFL